MTVRVGATERNPTHHASISDGNKTLGIIFTDGEGEQNPRALQASPYPRTSLRTSTGENKYSDLEPPYFAIAQDDFTGGRGNEDLEKDTSRYYDGHWMDTTKENGVVLGGRETYSTGLRNMELNLPGSLTWQALYSTYRFLAKSFAASASYTTEKVEMWVRVVGAPGTLTVDLYSNSGGDPNASLATITLTTDTFGTDTLSKLQSFAWVGTTAVTSGTTYWVVISGAATDDINNHWEVGTDAETAGKQSTAGSSWSASTMSPYYRITPADTDFTGFFFEYKRGLYFVPVYDDGSTASLYLNGDRGLADDNTGQLTKLIDATQSWTADEWIGCKVIITDGPGAEENQNWRTITDNDTTSLTVDPAWNVVHTTSTEYVITGGNVWKEYYNLASVVTDVKVMGDYVYFARGENASTAIWRYQEWNNSGVWSQRGAAESPEVRYLLGLKHSSAGEVIYGVQNKHEFNGVNIFRGRVPRKWGPLYRDLGELVDSTKPWDSRSVTNVTQSTNNGHTRISVAAGFTTGIAAVQDLDTPLDITAAKQISMLIKSSVSTSSGDLKFLYDDYANLGKTFSPADAWFLDDPLGAATYTDIDEAFDGDADTEAQATMTADDYLVIGGAVPFDTITFDLDEVNNNAATMSGQYFNGSLWTALTVTDGTETGGATLGQDGSVTFTIPKDWEAKTVNSVEAYYVRLKPSAALDAVGFRNTTLTRSNNVVLTIDGLTAGEWAYVDLDITPEGDDRPDETSVASVGIRVDTDNGAQVIDIRYVNLLAERTDWDATYAIPLPSSFRVTGIEAYAGSADDPVENPWVFTEDKVYELQTQNDDIILPVPLREMSSLQSNENGIAHTVNGTYLFFNLGQKIERYFNRTLDDVGPDRDSGLPTTRQGIPRSLASYPGRVLAGIDANTNTSSILGLKGEAWHEIYRAPRDEERIRSLYVQSIPGSNVAKLWFTMGSDVLWIPLSLNPYYDSDYNFTHEGHLITSWNYANLQDVRKLWGSLKLFLEDVDEDNRYVLVDYQVDDDTDWTEIGTFDEVPVKELEIDSVPPTSRRIRYRLRFYTDDEDETPRLKAMVSEGVAFVPVKFQFSFTTTFKTDEQNLLGEIDSDWASPEEKLDFVRDIANNGTGVIWRCNEAAYDNKKLFLDPPVSKPLIDVPRTGQESYSVSISAIEV